MNEQIEALLHAGAISTTLFPPNSRYHEIGTLKYTRADGRTIVYLRRRFIAQPGAFVTLVEHTIVESDRGRNDLLAARYLGDPELAWRLCDANVVLDPDELSREIGNRVRITLPPGVPAPAIE